MAVKKLTAEELLAACDEPSQEWGIRISSVLEPLAGAGAPVKPAVYVGGRYQQDRRWWGEGDQRRPVDVIVIDNVPSQANRIEAELQRLRSELRLPEFVLDLSSERALPPHLPRRLSSFKFPHRQADAYLRDAMLDGEAFTKTEIGKALFSATADDAEPILRWFPQALLFGFWQSHLGKKRSQAKLARAWVSEIVGYEPATSDTKALGLKGDPLNLSVNDPVIYDEGDLLSGWEYVTAGSKKGGSKQKESLSEIGHGQVPAGGSPSGVSFAAIEQQATVSFAALRRVRLADAKGEAAARATLVALGLVGHIAAFDRSFSLRSGCELRPAQKRWTWLGSHGDEDLELPDLEQATVLFKACCKLAESAGLPVGSAWPETSIVLAPNKELANVIAASWPLEEL
ncbi:MAG TPA: type I-U CRISPR-associated RAMP protein Csb1/Cas7u [Actinomycetota bacterium]